MEISKAQKKAQEQWRYRLKSTPDFIFFEIFESWYYSINKDGSKDEQCLSWQDDCILSVRKDNILSIDTTDSPGGTEKADHTIYFKDPVWFWHPDHDCEELVFKIHIYKDFGELMDALGLKEYK